MSIKVSCIRCGKMFEVPDEAGKAGFACPHCGLLHSEAVIAQRGAGPAKAATPSTAFTANLPPETLAGTSSFMVRCPSCGYTFYGPNEPEQPWLSCPHCHEVNPDALIKRAPPPAKERIWLGGFLVVLGVLGLTVGTFFCCLGMGLRHIDQPAEFIDIAVIVIWAAASIAIITTGVFLSSKKARAIDMNFWGPGVFFLIIMFLGFAGWIFAFSTCTFLTR